MSAELLDVLCALFFLVVLTLVSRFEKQLKQEDRQGYYNIVGGLVVLAMVSLARMYHGIGLFAVVPFLSEPIFFRLTNWIGVIVGCVLTVSGISHWLPLSRTYRRFAEERLGHLELIKKMEQLAALDTNTPSMLSQAAQMMVDHCRLDRGEVFLCSQRRRVFIQLDSSGKPASETTVAALLTDLAARVGWSDQGLLDTDALLRQWPDEDQRPQAIVPVEVNGRTAAMFLLNGETELSAEARADLKMAGEVVARVIDYRKLHAMAQHLANREDCWRRFVAAIDLKRGVGDCTIKIARQLKSILAFDYMSLTVLTNRRQVHRFSVGSNSTLLKEKGLDYETFMAQLEPLLSVGQPAIRNNVTGDSLSDIDTMIVNSSLNSVVLVPLLQDGSVEGVLALGSRSRRAFDRLGMDTLRMISTSLAQALSSESMRFELRRRERRHDRINRFLEEISRLESSESIFRRAATMLADELKTTMVRIGTIDASGNFLESKAMVLQQSMDVVAPPDGHLILSLMPYHQLVSDNGRVMMINQEDTANPMIESERCQAFFPEMKSALLVPVKLDGRVVGIIGLAEARSWDRYRYDQGDIRYATSIAGALGLSMHRMQSSTQSAETPWRARTSPRISENVVEQTH